MAGVGQTASRTKALASVEEIRRQVLLIPEAPLLLGLLLAGWAFGFPPVVSTMAMLVVGVFVVRLFLLSSATHELDNGHYAYADRYAEAALRIYPWSADALMVRAKSYLLQGDEKRAEVLLHRALRLAPESEAVHSALAAILLARADYIGARDHALIAGEVAAGSPLALQHLSWLALHIERDPAKSARLLQGIQPQSLPPHLLAPLLVLQGETHLAHGEHGAARVALSGIQALLPRCPVPLQAELNYHLGRLSRSLGNEHRRFFRQCVDLDPRGRWAHAAWRAAIDVDGQSHPLEAS
jgi:tetratricopeptide (TPR) repeat protein